MILEHLLLLLEQFHIVPGKNRYMMNSNAQKMAWVSCASTRLHQLPSFAPDLISTVHSSLVDQYVRYF
jgi:hypothetical protein